MDGEALNTFLMVYRQRGFSNAARALNRTQPAISHRISLLEQELGMSLFERTSNGIALSQAGRVLLPYAERALAALQDAETAVSALKTENAGPLSLAVVGTLASTSLTSILKRFAADCPSVDLALQTTRSTEVSDLVRRGEATIGIRYDRDRSPDLHYERLGLEKMAVACSMDHELAGRSIKSLAELVSERWLAFPEIPGQREIWASHVFSVFQTFGLGEIEWTPVDSLTAQKRLVEAGFGLALMTESAVAEERAAGTLATIDVRDLTLTIPIFLVTRRDGFLSVAANRLRDSLKSDYLGHYEVSAV
ncbi:MAG: LysR family transcriptional regulator [Aquamicrobium sp.]|uniref:LysR family transcriptional regulator n=1 Tax=Mesorhizobium sp. Pch-S TaxID=2082387 RepID=UPI00101394B9|nr:LysR family transcriptional regulator [Mesorhizobium sp. Pch-S]MBR2686253.1 LysR family transcriptional regulator [Aquamicrobium sp.]QAZ44136.1 LysR family transcriptional regulator [Mesorhizobium sp. Pch-S]